MTVEAIKQTSQPDDIAARVAVANKYAAELVRLAKVHYYGDLTVTFKDGTIIACKRIEQVKL